MIDNIDSSPQTGTGLSKGCLESFLVAPVQIWGTRCQRASFGGKIGCLSIGRKKIAALLSMPFSEDLWWNVSAKYLFLVYGWFGGCYLYVLFLNSALFLKLSWTSKSYPAWVREIHLGLERGASENTLIWECGSFLAVFALHFCQLEIEEAFWSKPAITQKYWLIGISETQIKWAKLKQHFLLLKISIFVALCK